MGSTISAIEARSLDATAVNIVRHADKVLQIVAGGIPVPEVAEFFITNHCSFNCPYCRCAKFHEGVDSSIDFELFKRAVDELAALGCKTVEFGGGGEPLEHPEIERILRYLKLKGMRCGIITNGYRFVDNRPLIDAVVDVADWVRVSIDATTDRTLRRVHGRKDISYGALKAALMSLVGAASVVGNAATRTRLGLKYLVQTPNQAELAMAGDEARDIGADYLQFKWLEDHPFALRAQDRPGALATLEALRRDMLGTMPVDILAGYGTDVDAVADQRCLMSILHPLIDWTGKVYICAFFHHRADTHCLGDLNHQTFSQLWYSDDHARLVTLVDPRQCVPNCPLKRYNPIVDFIAQEAYRFNYV